MSELEVSYKVISDALADSNTALLSNNEPLTATIIPTEPQRPINRGGRPKGSKNKPKRGRPKTKGARSTKKLSSSKEQQTPQHPPKIWEKYLVRVNDVIDENKPLLTFGEHLFVSSGGIATISGKPKSCKTFLTSAIIGAFLLGEYLNIISHNKEPSTKVLLCDTEQGRARTQVVTKRVQTIAGHNTQRFNGELKALSVREMSSGERLRVFIDAIYDIKPKLVVIDGVRDLLNDFNSIDESAKVVNDLMKVASDVDCAIIVVIHLNKGDDNVRGHLGAELCNKCETVVKLNRNESGEVTVAPYLCRDREFEEFAFRISEDGLPIACGVPPRNAIDKEKQKINKLRELFESLFEGRDTICKKELIAKVATSMGQSHKTAERRITDGEREQIISPQPNGSFKLVC